jgi:tripartite ATP-independent transporter DctM subunit
MGIDWIAATLMLMGGVLGVMFLGTAVAFAFMIVNLIGAWFFLGGEAGLIQFVRNGVLGVSAFSLVPIPLFIFMGEMLFQSGLAIRAIDAVDRVISRVPGRLPVVVIVAGTIFSAISGSTIATTAMLGALLLPEMLKRGYNARLAMGSIMGIGAVDMLIPPSGLAVLLGSLSNIPITDLLIGGVVPGFLLSVAFIGYIILACIIDPTLAPQEEPPKLTFKERWWPLLRDVVPLVLIFATVVISMTAGWATPTEAAAVGAFATIAVAILYRAFTIQGLIKALQGTGAVTAAILLIVMGATTFAQILSFSGATNGFVTLVTEKISDPWLVLFGMIALLLFLGVFIDQVSMMLMTLPFFMPLVAKFGFDPTWYGIIYLICMQLGLLTPPFGLLLFAMRGVAPPQVKTTDIYMAVIPYIVMTLLMLGAIILFPPLATWLPRLLD